MSKTESYNFGALNISACTFFFSFVFALIQIHADACSDIFYICVYIYIWVSLDQKQMKKIILGNP